MADNFADFYTSAMAPPDRLPGGGLVPSVNYSPQATAADVYGGIIAPAAGRVTAEGLAVRPVQTVAIDSSGNPILNQIKQNAVAQALVNASPEQVKAIRDVSMLSQRAYDPRMRSADASKVDTRFPQQATYPFGYSPENQRNAALAVAEALAAPAKAQYGNYVAQLRPAAQRTNVTYEAGMRDGLGVPMSAGMASILNTDPRYAAQRTRFLGPNAAPVVRPVNRTQQALAQVAAASQPQAAPRVAVNPGYITTPYEQSWAQTTENALMPSAGGERRRTGY